MIKSIKISNVKLKNNILMAPLAGYTDVGFRSLCHEYGAGLTFTEMVSVKGLLHNPQKTMELLYREKNDSPCAVQLFGNVPEDFIKAINHPILKDFDIIDINMGCPAPKIVKNGEGSALLKNISLAEEIISSCVKATTKPVSVKFRIGYDENDINAIEFAKMCERAGASFITIHGRTTKQQYSGHSDWNIIKKCADEVNIPVFANGDILEKRDIDSIMCDSKVAGVMIGRGALGNPEIFSVLQGKDVKVNKLEQIKRHIEIYRKYFSDRYVLVNMRKHICFYIKGKNGSKELRTKIVTSESFDELFYLLEEYLR